MAKTGKFFCAKATRDQRKGNRCSIDFFHSFLMLLSTSLSPTTMCLFQVEEAVLKGISGRRERGDNQNQMVCDKR